MQRPILTRGMRAEYADPGMRADEQPRYPVDTPEHVEASWQAINQADDAECYTPEQCAAIKDTIRAAAERFGITLEDSARSFSAGEHPHVPAGSSTGGQFAAKGGGGKATKPHKAAGHHPATHPATHSGSGNLGFDAKTGRGTGYGSVNGDSRVHSLQQALNRLGVTDSSGKPLKDDGKLGPKTTAALKKLQTRLGMKADGQVTPEFLKAVAAMKKLPAHHTAAKRGEDLFMTQPTPYRRVFALEGIDILTRAKGGDGRTVEAYAAVFNVPKEIHDAHGDYVEDNDPRAFNRTINSGAAMRAQVLYNHGFDARGKSGGLPTVPIGHSKEIRADSRGLLTVSRYNESEFSDMVLASIRNGDIKAQSYEGTIYRSNPDRPPGRAKPGAKLPRVTRLEMGLKNYGPTPNAYYEEAEIVAVRSVTDLADDFAHLEPEQRDELIRALSTTPGWDSEIAAILATPHRGPGAEDSRTAHSVRQKKIRLRAELLARSL